MTRYLFVLLALMTLTRPALTQGMWLPTLLEKYNIEEMRKMGFRLSAEDIYSTDKPSMKDAVVRIGGCTGVVISETGLVLTNHHCGYRVIQSHSTVDNDYLTDGFWAMTPDEELPGRGLTVTFLVRMEDVTQRVLSVVDETMDENQRQAAINIISGEIEDEAINGTHYTAAVNAFYFGSEYFLFVYEVFEDVRLVGAPPSSIGKFGGDTDNWMWPRHTGDFTFFRIYADSQNKPAPYSAQNVPYRSEVHLPVSAGGVKEDDFTMVFGFPGSTRQYLTSQAVDQITRLSNPHSIRLRDERLAIMGREMEMNDTVRIKYAAKFSSVSNAWKRWQGENLGLRRLDAVSRKEELETRFAGWVEDSPGRISRYGNVLPAFDSLYCLLEHYTLPYFYGQEALYAIEAVRFVNDFLGLTDRASGSGRETDRSRLTGILDQLSDNFFRDYHLPVDRQVFSTLLSMYMENIKQEFHPAFFGEVIMEYNSDFDRFADRVFSESDFVSQERVAGLLHRYEHEDAGFDLLENDILVRIVRDIGDVYNKRVADRWNSINDQLTPHYRLFVEGLREMKPDRAFFPDANRTLRVAYGQVRGYYPRDGVYYNKYTTLSGVMEKGHTGDPDYLIPGRLREIYKNGDRGRFAVDGEMRVNFIASNHTTGGNSGSPVINGDGHLIGVNFDRVWEGTMSDIMFDPAMGRNISVDVNYILFITEMFAGAGHIIEEMTIIR
jgi:hypothetical protein